MEPGPVAARATSVVEWTLGLTLMGVVAVNVVNATGRYLFAHSFTGADELMVYVMIFVVMTGAVLALARRSHINVDLLPSCLSGRRLRGLHLLHDVIALAAASFAVYASWTFTARIARLGTTSMTLGIPMAIPHAVVLLGFIGMAIVALVMLVRDLSAVLSADPGPRR